MTTFFALISTAILLMVLLGIYINKRLKEYKKRRKYVIVIPIFIGIYAVLFYSSLLYPSDVMTAIASLLCGYFLAATLVIMQEVYSEIAGEKGEKKMEDLHLATIKELSNKLENQDKKINELINLIKTTKNDTSNFSKPFIEVNVGNIKR